MRRVVVTGIGVVCPAGIGKDDFWKSMTEGRSCIRKITKFDASELSSQMAGEVDGFVPENYINNSKDLRRMDIASQYAIAATKMSVEDSGIDLSQEDPARIGLFIGSAIGGPVFLEKQVISFFEKGIKSISPFTGIAYFCCSHLGFISIEFGIKGSNATLSTGCTSGHTAIGTALNDIRYGRSDMAVAGGTESPLIPLILQSFCVIHATSRRNEEPEKASRPFDKERDGFVLAEGCGILLLEELEHALKRNAHIYAEIAGFGTTCNAYHMTAPSEDAKETARAMKLALDDAGIEPKDVDNINAHGSSTPLNEIAETLAIKQVFGEDAYKIPVNSIKSMIGHALGGAGAIQAAASVLTIENGLIPPTINYEHPDSACDLDCVPNETRKAKVNAILQNGCGFSGLNAAIVYRRFEG